MDSDFVTKLSSHTSKKLFETGVPSVFEDIAHTKLPEKTELAPEFVYKDPFEHLKEREDLLTSIRLQLATDIKDPRQVLKTAPSVITRKTEAITNLPGFLSKHAKTKVQTNK